MYVQYCIVLYSKRVALMGVNVKQLWTARTRIRTYAYVYKRTQQIKIIIIIIIIVNTQPNQS
jgi:hypothetical protein